MAWTVLYVALTVLYMSLTVLYVALAVLHVALTVLYVDLTVLYAMIWQGKGLSQGKLRLAARREKLKTSFQARAPSPKSSTFNVG